MLRQIARRTAVSRLKVQNIHHPSIPVFFSCFHKNHWLHYVAGGSVSEERGDI
jgi:hypothetical protein